MFLFWISLVVCDFSFSTSKINFVAIAVYLTLAFVSWSHIDSTKSDFFCRSFGLTSYTKLSVQAIFFKSFSPTKLTVFDNPAVLAHSSYIVLSFILHVHVVNFNCINNKHVNSNQIIKFCIKCQLCFNYWCWSIHSLALKYILFPWNHGRMQSSWIISTQCHCHIFNNFPIWSSINQSFNLYQLFYNWKKNMYLNTWNGVGLLSLFISYPFFSHHMIWKNKI